MKCDSTEFKQFINDHSLAMPVTVNIGLHKVVDRLDPQGNHKRYLKVYSGDFDITKFIADATGLTMSNAKDTNGCIIIHGSGMDMGLALIMSVNRHLGCKALNEEYNYLGKWSRGKYCA